MLSNDCHFGHLFKDGMSKNDKIAAMQKEFKHEILKLTQAVLLN